MPIRACIGLPVDAPQFVAGIVLSVVHELGRVALEARTVPSAVITLHDGPRRKEHVLHAPQVTGLEVLELLRLVPGHGRGLGLAPAAQVLAARFDALPNA